MSAERSTPISPDECPVPSYHLTHRYCPHCSWTEPTDAMDEAMAAAAQLGAALARMDNALDKLRDAGCDVAPQKWGHDSTEKLMERVTAGIMSDSGDDTTQADADAALTELAERVKAAEQEAADMRKAAGDMSADLTLMAKRAEAAERNLETQTASMAAALSREVAAREAAERERDEAVKQARHETDDFWSKSAQEHLARTLAAEAQRDELVEALERAQRYLRDSAYLVGASGVLEEVDAVLAKVRE